MERYSRHLGLAYQIHNDLKDVVLDEAETGKTIHHDAALNKNTYPSLLGIAGAIQELNDVIRQAEDSLNRVVLSNGDTENKIDVFRQILDYVRI
jgi:geranylgeranyl diphosphate synthase type II